MCSLAFNAGLGGFDTRCFAHNRDGLNTGVQVGEAGGGGADEKIGDAGLVKTDIGVVVDMSCGRLEIGLLKNEGDRVLKSLKGQIVQEKTAVALFNGEIKSHKLW